MKTEHIAKRGKSSKNEMYVDSESSQRKLSEEEPDQTLPRNNLPASTSLPEVTQKLDSFNTAQEKAPSEKSDEHPPKEVVATQV